MALGLQTTTQQLGRPVRRHVIRILEEQTATNSPPASYADAGVDVMAILEEEGLYRHAPIPDVCGLWVWASAGTGVVTATVKLWAGVPDLAGVGRYGAASTGEAATAGVLNGGSAFDEHSSDVINRLDVVLYPWLAQKFYAEVTAIGGTGTAVNVDMIFKAVMP